MNLQRQTAQNSPHSRRTSWVWSTKSNERNDHLYGRRTGSLRAKPGIHTDTESTRARCTATPRGLRRLHRAADLRAFPDRQGFFPSLAFLEQTQVRRSPHLDKSGQHAAHALQKRSTATSLSPSQLSRLRLVAVPGPAARRDSGARRSSGGRRPARGTRPRSGAGHGVRGAGGGTPRPLSPLTRPRLRARGSASRGCQPGPRPPQAAAADGTSQPAPRSPDTYPHHPRARRRGRGVARERPVLSLRSSAPESAEDPEMAEQREPRSAAAAPPIGRGGRAGGGARRAGAGGGDSGR